MMKKFLITFGILLSLSCTLKADSFPIYDVTGTVTFTGNDVCGGPCVYVDNFSFTYTTQLSLGNPGIYQPVISGTPLNEYYTVIGSDLGELDLFLEGSDGSFPPTYSFDTLPDFYEALWSCNQLCFDDFEDPSEYARWPVNSIGYPEGITSVLQYTGTLVPEPPVYMVLPLSLLGLFALRRSLSANY